MTPEQLAQIAYEAWSRYWVKGPCWNCLPKAHRLAWIAAAQAVKANVLSGFTKVGEGEQA